MPFQLSICQERIFRMSPSNAFIQSTHFKHDTSIAIDEYFPETSFKLV
jgi:hypothetical protein